MQRLLIFLSLIRQQCRILSQPHYGGPVANGSEPTLRNFGWATDKF